VATAISYVVSYLFIAIIWINHHYLVQEAARERAWLKAMVESGELYPPLRWSAAEAFQFLTDVPDLEAAGIVVRAPSAWGSGRPPRPKVRATIGERGLRCM
jgi:hypothetical protein